MLISSRCAATVFFPVLWLLVFGSAHGQKLEPDPDRCSLEKIKASSDPAFLRSAVATCSDAAWVAALAKLFALPLPAAPAVKLSAPVVNEATEQATLELDLFYDIADPYPPDEAIAMVDQLLGRLVPAFEVHSITITGSVDRAELKTGLASEIATRRARKIETYLRSAGLNPTAGIRLAVAEPSHPDSAEGRARDRSVKLRVTIQRQKELQ